MASLIPIPYATPTSSTRLWQKLITWGSALQAGRRAELGELVTVTPGVRSGKACVKGTRITVSDVLGYMASGMSQEEILLDFAEPNQRLS
jgi:uncharacterized protein (DUF433 family)